jgi:YHS domain-containing protein
VNNRQEDTMKTTLRAFVMSLLAAALIVPVMAGDKPLRPEDLKPQTLCPVMGNAIDSTVYTDYQGQRVYFCCPGCIETFLANPDTYFVQAAKDSVLFRSVQTVCPVMGNPVDPAYWLWYEGRGIYFCCPACIDTFLAEPAKYLGGIR